MTNDFGFELYQESERPKDRVLVFATRRFSAEATHCAHGHMVEDSCVVFSSAVRVDVSQENPENPKSLPGLSAAAC